MQLSDEVKRAAERAADRIQDDIRAGGAPRDIRKPAGELPKYLEEFADAILKQAAAQKEGSA